MKARKPSRRPINVPLDLNRLRMLLGSNPIAQSVLEFTARKPSPHLDEFSTLDHLHKTIKDPNGKSWPRRRLTRTLRELALVGCGRLRVGRHGSLSRFKWTAAPAELLKRPELGLTLAPGSTHAVRVTPAIRATPTRPDLTPRLMEHVFYLRPDQQVTVLLPSDLTEKEADRLARFITALPFA